MDLWISQQGNVSCRFSLYFSFINYKGDTRLMKGHVCCLALYIMHWVWWCYHQAWPTGVEYSLFVICCNKCVATVTDGSSWLDCGWGSLGRYSCRTWLIWLQTSTCLHILQKNKTLGLDQSRTLKSPENHPPPKTFKEVPGKLEAWIM